MLRVYESLLGQRGMEDAGEQLHLPVVRLRLLRSLLTVLSPLVHRMQDRQPGLLPYATFQGGARREVRHNPCTIIDLDMKHLTLLSW